MINITNFHDGILFIDSSKWDASMIRHCSQMLHAYILGHEYGIISDVHTTTNLSIASYGLDVIVDDRDLKKVVESATVLYITSALFNALDVGAWDPDEFQGSVDLPTILSNFSVDKPIFTLEV